MKLSYDKPCKYCKKTVHINKSHIRLVDNTLAHIRCNEDHNSHKSYCITCGGEIVILHSYVVTETLRIKKDGTLAKNSHKTDGNGEGTHVFNAHCEDCDEEYQFQVLNGIYRILGKSF